MMQKERWFMTFGTGWSLFIACMFLVLACAKSDDVVVKSLQVEYQKNPYGVDVDQPRFSWQLDSKLRGVQQQAWQVIVSENPGEVRKGSGSVWDSGVNRGDETAQLEYKGAPLKSNTTYYWRVCAWIDGETAVWSEPAFFHTGILNETEWQAEWITSSEAITHGSPLLRKEFVAKRKVKQATAFVTACGYYELLLNGEKVGDHVLDPAITTFQKTILYSAYDVTSMLKSGNNVVGAMIGNGGWNQRKTEGRWSWGKEEEAFGNPCLIVQLMISYSDGTQESVVSDGTWRWNHGPILYNNIYGGEDYDARKEQPGWASAGFDDRNWHPVAIADDPGGKLKAQLMPPMKVNQTIQPVREINPEPGLYLFDLGQNMAGWWRLQVKGKPGQVIRIRGSETLNDSLFSKPLEEGDRLSTKFKYHAEVWTDYTIASDQVEVYEPRFFYSGFRYLEVTTSDQTNPEQLRVEGRVIYSALDRNGTFESSDTLLNWTHRAGLWAQKGNLHGYPTDCPHREKGAYGGDGQVIAESSMHDFHMAPLYVKWVNDMRDAQEENGRIPNTTPTLVGGKGGGIAWGSAYILIPWWMHHYYGDTRVLKDHYPTMKRYLSYIKEVGTRDEDPSEPFIIDYFDGFWFSLGEWCAPGQRDCPNHAVVNTFYFYYNCRLLSEIAGLLGHPEDVSYYASLADTVRQNLNRRFFNPETALYGTDETYQTYQLLALMGDIVPEGYREKVFQTIVDDIEQRNNHLNTGIIGTKYLWPILVQGGEHELAFKVATQTTYPGFGYWFENDATTLLEKWEGLNSHNHQMFGSITEYFYKFLGGIQSPMEGVTSKSYKKILIKPFIPEGLDFVNCSVEVNSGKVVSNWKKRADGIIFDVTIPANSKAIIALPMDEAGQVTLLEGTEYLWKDGESMTLSDGIESVTRDDDRIVIQAGSGSYKFRLE